MSRFTATSLPPSQKPNNTLRFSTAAAPMTKNLTGQARGRGTLNAISFYDEACGEAYVEKESELGYRPSALALLDGLIALCDRVAAALELELQENAAEFAGLPDPPEETSAAEFLTALSGNTTQADLDAACALGPDADTELAKLRQEEARLMASNPAEEVKMSPAITLGTSIG